MTICGFWTTARRLVVVVADNDRRPSAIIAARTEKAQWALLEHLDFAYGPDCSLVVPEELASAPIASFAACRGLPVWIAPRPLLDAITVIASPKGGSARKLALALAHLPRSRLLGRYLKRLAVPTARQPQLL